MWRLCRAHIGWGTMARPSSKKIGDHPWMRRARRLHSSREMNLTPTSRARRTPWKASASLLVACALSAPGSARAYTIENAFSTGCHEQITSQALRTVRTEVATAAPLALTDNEQALVDDLQFTPESDMKDLGAVTLLVSVRDNDLKGRGSGDLTELAEIHGDPGDQREHCLRGPGQKEPNGSAEAVADCRAFIRERVLASLEGLDAAGRPDLAKRTSLAVHLSIRGRVDASLPTYYVRVGQAIHAVEDSFTHTYRTPDGMQITVALDWLDSVNKTLVESRDGPAHAAQALRRHPHDPANPDHTFYFHVDDKHVIDGKHTGNSAKWINHGCAANCEAEDVDGRIFVKALRAIKPGEELAYDYGLVLEGRHTPKVKKQFECRCGSRRCRGTMLAPKR